MIRQNPEALNYSDPDNKSHEKRKVTHEINNASQSPCELPQLNDLIQPYVCMDPQDCSSALPLRYAAWTLHSGGRCQRRRDERPLRSDMKSRKQ